jgi:hypothetical protein
LARKPRKKTPEPKNLENVAQNSVSDQLTDFLIGLNIYFWDWFLFFFIVLGFVVTFTKVFTIYQVYHTWIHPLHHFPLSCPSHSWYNFNRSHFSIYRCMYTVFGLCSPSYILSSYPPTSHCYQLPKTRPVLPSCFCKKKMTFLFKIVVQGVS